MLKFTAVPLSSSPPMQSAKQGNVLAMCRLGLAYKHGHGVAQDYSKAHETYGKAAEHGSVDAYCNLGYMYLNGKGVDIDHKEAVKWCESPAPHHALRTTVPVRTLRCIGAGTFLFWCTLLAVR
jgi:TPR repeat protein